MAAELKGAARLEGAAQLRFGATQVGSHSANVLSMLGFEPPGKERAEGSNPNWGSICVEMDSREAFIHHLSRRGTHAEAADPT